MEKLTGCFLLVLLSSVVAEDKFIGDGGTLELTPKVSGNITTIKWKLNQNTVNWERGETLTYPDTFKGRTTLNTKTGRLNITNMTPADSGEYSVKINSAMEPALTYTVKVIKEVPQPVVGLNPLTCSDASKSCTLVCEKKSDEAVALAEAEPVTYSWKMGEGVWMNGEKSRTITNDKETQGVETFSCRMKNPISEKPSDPIPNPFSKTKASAHSGVAGSVSVDLLVVVLAAVFGAGF
ncbi:uncharacterized protein LOC128373263 [Scomber japonicus]|uniref:uncharacterized protein LOC128373263 n=1 Tax=Scomber japonicus TaxID=13676 RepID=UPI00230556B0|nr:uncharacterized protein LOC128373263 [Scomber japonicus]